MGLINFIKAVFVRREIRKIKKISPVEKSIDDMMADELKGLAATNRYADKLLKVKIMRQEGQHALNKIAELDEEESDEYDDDESPDTFEEKLKNQILSKILGGNQQPQQPQEQTFEDGVPPQEQQKENPLVEGLSSLTPTEINKIKSKFLG